MEDKVKIIKNLLGLHQGEIRESYGFWEKKADPLPSQEAYAAYYSKQYARGEGIINAFLSHSVLFVTGCTSVALLLFSILTLLLVASTVTFAHFESFFTFVFFRVRFHFVVAIMIFFVSPL